MRNTPAAATAYRPDIDGLRAVAVLAVLAFHAFPEAAPGGFAGVDIFFVISGFLISGIILSHLREGTFTFGGFYVRRVRRIFPALLLVLAACLAFGWSALLPYNFTQFGAHVAAGAGFVSNVLLWSESGYFDTNSALKPLLHLWSLGIEEQYYIVWPVLLFLLRRHVHRIFWMIALIAAASFAINLLVVHHSPTAAFYSPVTRFWELMLGSLLAYARLYLVPATASTPGADRHPWKQWWRGAAAANTLSVAGASLIAVSLAVLDKNRAFPGWWALLPCMGALLLILAGPDGCINRWLLARRAMVFVGLISYPLYLWHWPLLSFARIFLGTTPPIALRAGALIASFGLAWMTYAWVERPIRHPGNPARATRTAAVLVSCMAAVGAYGWLAFENVTVARSATVLHLAQISAAYSDWDVHPEASFPGDTPDTVLFFGDSHMQQFLPRIESLIQAHRAALRTVIFRTRGGCAPIPGIDRPHYGCATFVDDAVALARRPEVRTVVISASWAGFVDRTDYYRSGDENGDGPALQLLTPGTEWVLRGFEAAVADLVARGKQVVIVLSSPFGTAFDPREMAHRDGFDFTVTIPEPVPRENVTRKSAAIDRRILEIAVRTHSLIVNPLDTLCRGSVCPVVDEDGNPLLKDDSHLRSSVVSAHFTALDRFVYR